MGAVNPAHFVLLVADVCWGVRNNGLVDGDGAQFFRLFRGKERLKGFRLRRLRRFHLSLRPLLEKSFSPRRNDGRQDHPKREVAAPRDPQAPSKGGNRGSDHVVRTTRARRRYDGLQANLFQKFFHALRKYAGHGNSKECRQSRSLRILSAASAPWSRARTRR